MSRNPALPVDAPLPIIRTLKPSLSEVKYFTPKVTKLLSGRAVQLRQARLEARVSPSQHA